MLANSEISGSFIEHFPQQFDGTLENISFAVTCSFNRYGTLLAVGCNDGRIIVYDFLTRGIAKVILGHIHPITNLCWSRNGYKLISSSDKDVCVWNVLTSMCEYKFCFPSLVLKVQFHPRNMEKILVCPMKLAPLDIIIYGVTRMIPIDKTCKMQVIASYDRRGKYIYSGNGRGYIMIIDAEIFVVIATFQISMSNPVIVKSIEFARRGGLFLVIGSDKIVRLYDSEKAIACGVNGILEPDQKIQDMISRCAWKKCCFSGDGEYICGGSGKEHALYIWEKSTKNLLKLLQGSKGELLQDMAWHPIRPILVSISSGLVSIWKPTEVYNWSAFIPNFTELDENVYHEERESEFDITDEDKSFDIPHDLDNSDDIDIDVTTVSLGALGSSDEESEANALHILTVEHLNIESDGESSNG